MDLAVTEPFPLWLVIEVLRSSNVVPIFKPGKKIWNNFRNQRVAMFIANISWDIDWFDKTKL